MSLDMYENIKCNINIIDIELLKLMWTRTGVLLVKAKIWIEKKNKSAATWVGTTRGVFYEFSVI